MAVDLIGFDADDTLWQNERYYRQGRQTFLQVMERYGLPPQADARVHQLEIENLKYYGYGAVGFAISLAEAAIELTEGRVAAADIQTLLQVSKSIIGAEVELYEQAEKVVARLAQSHRLLLVTKGDLLHQRSKLKRSGLAPFFGQVEVVSEKQPEVYAEILQRIGVEPPRFLMIGNSMKSDILPVLKIGGLAAYIHRELTWSHEVVDEAELPGDRYFEVSDLASLPRLVASLDA